MRILLTNDDGINAEGLLTLYHQLKSYYKVNVVAPDRERSATGHGITMHKPLRVEEVALGDTDEKSWAVSSTPTDCVKLAVEALLPEQPDIVVSGINFGSNIGTDVLYSGTVSAAIEGTIAGFKSLAVSLDTRKDIVDFSIAARFIVKFVNLYNDCSVPADTLLNINVPEVTEENLKGVKVTKLGKRKYIDSVEQRKDPRGKAYFWLAGEIRDQDGENGTDSNAIKNNMISICPVHFDLTKYEMLDEIRNWDIKL